jgi:hypothetical protein
MDTDTIAILRILNVFRDYKIVYENYYLTSNVTKFTKIVEIIVRPDLEIIKVRLGLDDTDIDNQ